MADPQIVNTLRNKKAEIERTILGYEKLIKTARKDLSHVNASIRLFEINDKSTQFPVYVDLHRLFKRGEVMEICKEALAAKGNLTTRQLAERVIKVKGLDRKDKILRTSLTYRIVMALRQQEKRGRVERLGKVQGVIVWQYKASAHSAHLTHRTPQFGAFDT